MVAPIHVEDEDDADLRRALALSLGQDPASGNEGALPIEREKVVIDLDSDDEDFSRSLQVLGESGIGKPTDLSHPRRSQENGQCADDKTLPVADVSDVVAAFAKENVHDSNSPATLTADSKMAASSFLGLDRKQMEAERLARRRAKSEDRSVIQKAKRTRSPVPESSHKRLHVSSASPNSPLGRVPSGMQEMISAAGVQYPKGIVKKTWAAGFARCDDIKLEEVLQATDLRLAVLSSFQWDMAWVMQKLDLANTKVVLVMQAKEAESKERYQDQLGRIPNLRLCFPSMEGQVNCMHSKLMLLSFPEHLRVVIPTANLVPFDWGESGQMENMVFIIDLPRLPLGRHGVMSQFGEELVHFVGAQGLDRHIIDSLSNFDFTATTDMAFVHAIGGSHIGPSYTRTGYCGLATAIRRLGGTVNSQIDVDFVTSSVGSLDLDFLSSLYQACCGNDGSAEYLERFPASGKGIKRHEPAFASRVRKGLRVYFPTHETVRESLAGSAGTICMQSSYFDNPKFPKMVLRDCKSVRQGLLMHNKLILIRQENRAFAYVGSANCSQSAWGNRLNKDRVSKGPKLNCRNWECGVLLPAKSADTQSLNCFKSLVPIPFVHPAEQYGGRRPWFFMED